MRIAITGHRPSKFNNDYDLTSPLILRIKEKLQDIIDEKKPTIIISGMALGIDTLWAKLAMEKRQDRIIGELTRKVEFLQDSVNKRNEWLREAKREAGYSDGVSFDTVWRETLALALSTKTGKIKK